MSLFSSPVLQLTLSHNFYDYYLHNLQSVEPISLNQTSFLALSFHH